MDVLCADMSGLNGSDKCPVDLLFQGCILWLSEGGNMINRTMADEMFRDYRNALFKACSFIGNRLGSCPHDLLGIDPFDKPCSEVCKPDQRLDECWGAYFLGLDKKEKA